MRPISPSPGVPGETKEDPRKPVRHSSNRGMDAPSISVRLIVNLGGIQAHRKAMILRQEPVAAGAGVGRGCHNTPLLQPHYSFSIPKCFLVW